MLEILQTPAAQARVQIAQAMRRTPLLQRVILNEFDQLLKGCATFYLDRHEQHRTFVLRVLAHFKSKSEQGRRHLI